jgi:hypothetical protein
MEASGVVCVCVSAGVLELWCYKGAVNKCFASAVDEKAALVLFYYVVRRGERVWWISRFLLLRASLSDLFSRMHLFSALRNEGVVAKSGVLFTTTATGSNSIIRTLFWLLARVSNVSSPRMQLLTARASELSPAPLFRRQHFVLLILLPRAKTCFPLDLLAPNT